MDDFGPPPLTVYVVYECPLWGKFKKIYFVKGGLQSSFLEGAMMKNKNKMNNNNYKVHSLSVPMLLLGCNRTHHFSVVVVRTQTFFPHPHSENLWKCAVQMRTNLQKFKKKFEKKFSRFFLNFWRLVLIWTAHLDVWITVRVRTFLGFECGVWSAQCACGPHSRTVGVPLIAIKNSMFQSRI